MSYAGRFSHNAPVTSVPSTPTRHGVADIARVASGNFVEMYDFMVFGYFADAIGQAYFPGGSHLASLLKALATFGVGFAMRPLGAILLGGFTDRHGRRAGLLLTLSLMGVGIAALAFTPAYASIGVAAPAIVVAGRLVQGLSAGAELGTVSVYLAEIAPPHARGFWVSWQSASQQVAVVAAAAIGAGLSALLGPAALAAWGWRVPLALGCAVVPVLFVLRRHLRESHRPATPPAMRAVLAALWAGRASVLAGVALVLMTTVSFYLITAYTPSFGKLLGLPPLAVLGVTALTGLSNLVWLPAMGALSDRVGRRPILLACTALAVVTAWPAMAWLAAAPSLARLVAVELWLSALYGSYNAAMVVHLTEVVPASVRATGFSLAYSLATAIGGFTPFAVTALIARTGDRSLPGAWLAGAALLSLLAAAFAHRRPACEGDASGEEGARGRTA